jgi:hypothetical protein
MVDNSRKYNDKKNGVIHLSSGSVLICGVRYPEDNPESAEAEIVRCFSSVGVFDDIGL